MHRAPGRQRPRPVARLVGFAAGPAFRPGLLVVTLLVASVATYAVRVEPIGAHAPLAMVPIAGESNRAAPFPSIADAPAVGAIGDRPRSPIELDPAPTPTPPPPAVVRFRPRDGWIGVARATAVSVRFTEPMDHVSTERAFAASIDAAPIIGSYRWAEDDTVLVLQPASALPYGAQVRLAVSSDARSRAGGVLPAAQSVTFTVQGRSAPAATPRPTTTPRPTATGWRWPLIGPITQRFGESLTQYGFHQGIDIDGDTGDPVRAARSGTVTVTGHWDDCGGLQVHIDHGGGFESWYRHLSRIDVTVGQRVAAGTIIGAVGDTGCSLGSHLHFGIREGKVFVDPLRYLPPG